MIGHVDTFILLFLTPDLLLNKVSGSMVYSKTFGHLFAFIIQVYNYMW